jgi:hypothetical protein
MLGRHLDIAVVPTPVGFLVLDADVREVHLVIEVRQLVFVSPCPDFFRRAIWVTIVVIPVAITVVQPLLVLTLELVIEEDALDTSAALQEGFCFAFVRAADLNVVFQLPLASNAGVEGLLMLSVAVPMVLQQAPPFLRQRDDVLARAGQPIRLDEPLLAKVPKVARARIRRAIVVVAEITIGDYSKHTNSRQSAGFRSA